jgi:hypothetical protein
MISKPRCFLRSWAFKKDERMTTRQRRPNYLRDDGGGGSLLEFEPRGLPHFGFSCARTLSNSDCFMVVPAIRFFLDSGGRLIVLLMGPAGLPRTASTIRGYTTIARGSGVGISLGG